MKGIHGILPSPIGPGTSFGWPSTSRKRAGASRATLNSARGGTRKGSGLAIKSAPRLCAWARILKPRGSVSLKRKAARSGLLRAMTSRVLTALSKRPIPSRLLRPRQPPASAARRRPPARRRNRRSSIRRGKRCARRSKKDHAEVSPAHLSRIAGNGPPMREEGRAAILRREGDKSHQRAVSDDLTVK
jgi:hypothetical protein